MGEEIIIDKELLRAIGAESRINILKSLSEHQKTQSDLAKELNLSSPTVLEHLEQLSSAGLIEKIEEGRKWKYYILTSKGKQLMSSNKKRIPINAFIILGLFLIFTFVFLLYNPFIPLDNFIGQENYDKGTDSSNGLEVEALSQPFGYSSYDNEEGEVGITNDNLNQTNNTDVH